MNPPLRSTRVELLNSFYKDYMFRSADVKVCSSVYFGAEWAQRNLQNFVSRGALAILSLSRAAV